jgi:hypothetical protein
MDTYGIAPPLPDPTHFEHVQFLTSEPSFRILGDGIGQGTTARRNKSTELGQAFCRWFLEEHLGISHFAHISELLKRQAVRPIAGLTIQRVDDGDTPDYFCTDNARTVFLAEAKGRYTSIGFNTREFSSWRKQFSRIAVLDATRTPKRVKGHIVATRFATEKDSGKIQSTIFAEDPSTLGEEDLDRNERSVLASAITCIHYSRLMQKIDQPILSWALFNEQRLPVETIIPTVLWRLGIDNRSNRQFVGGYYPGKSGQPAYDFTDGNIRPRRGDPLRLDQSDAIFVGIELKVFERLIQFCRQGESILSLPLLSEEQRIYSAISMLKDGSIIGPLEFFTPVGNRQF